MSKRTDNFYNRFSFLYPLVDMFLKAHKRVLFQEINNVPFGKLLEIGVGNGKHLPMYRKHDIIGIDTSLSMLGSARKHKTKHVKLLQMNGEALLFPDLTFDYVVMCHVVAVVDNPEKLLNEAHRVLKPNGKMFILNHFTPTTWLRYIDYSAQIFSKMVHFKPVFYINSLKKIEKFALLKEISFGKHGYFKLLIYSKK